MSCLVGKSYGDFFFEERFNLKKPDFPLLGYDLVRILTTLNKNFFMNTHVGVFSCSKLC